jgi:pantothenate kinase
LNQTNLEENAFIVQENAIKSIGGLNEKLKALRDIRKNLSPLKKLIQQQYVVYVKLNLIGQWNMGLNQKAEELQEN